MERYVRSQVVAFLVENLYKCTFYPIPMLAHHNLKQAHYIILLIRYTKKCTHFVHYKVKFKIMALKGKKDCPTPKKGWLTTTRAIKKNTHESIV